VITSRCMRPCTFFFVRQAQDGKCRNVDSCTKNQFFLLSRLDISLSSPAEEKASASECWKQGHTGKFIFHPLDPIHNIYCAVNGARGRHINKAPHSSSIFPLCGIIMRRLIQTGKGPFSLLTLSAQGRKYNNLVFKMDAWTILNNSFCFCCSLAT
jgi:hypothetical protein